MARTDLTGGPREPEGAIGAHLTEAFELLSNETRLIILLTLWETYDPHRPDKSATFSELFDRSGVHDSGNFSYHLDKLVGHFVEETDGGYRLRDAGLKIVQATIAGTGLEERTLAPTEIDMTCYRCGGAVELSYENEHLYLICTGCEGNSGTSFVRDRPVGTLMEFDFTPAGLTDRAPEDVFVAGTIKSLRDFGSLIRGICPICSGPIDESVHICEDHKAQSDETCPTCGTGDEVRVSYVCSVCKHGDSYPVHAAIYDHPTVIAFCHEHGIETSFAIDEPDVCHELWDHLLKREYTLVSEDPVRIRVKVPGDGEALYLTLDQRLSVIDTARETWQHRGTNAQTNGPTDLRETDCDTSSHRVGTRNDEIDADLAGHENCLGILREQRWPDGVTCPHCDSQHTIKKGMTSKDAQRYRCRNCDRLFNDLTGTIFAQHRLSLPEMFFILQEADTTDTAQIARQVNRSYRTVLNFVHEIKESSEWEVKEAQ